MIPPRPVIYKIFPRELNFRFGLGGKTSPHFLPVLFGFVKRNWISRDGSKQEVTKKFCYLNVCKGHFPYCLILHLLNASYLDEESALEKHF